MARVIDTPYIVAANKIAAQKRKERIEKLKEKLLAATHEEVMLTLAALIVDTNTVKDRVDGMNARY